MGRADTKHRQRLPTGTLTFLFTDIEGSTRLLDYLGADSWTDALATHHRVIRDAIARQDGIELNTAGDAFIAVFTTARDALNAALHAQRSLAAQSWPGGVHLRCRMGVHTGEAQVGGDDYVGLVLHHAARVCAAAHGGQVVASDAAANDAGPLDEGVTLLPLGRHRLRDVGSPLELYQLGHPDLRAQFPPLRSVDAQSNNIPVPLSTFVGRGAEVAAITAQLRSARLVTMVGPGGAGKTRLAWTVAHEQVPANADGVWVTELAAVVDPSHVAGSLAAALGLQDQPGRSPTQTVVDYLRAKQALIVLDNCEHVIDAAASLASDLLRNCPDVRLLATSREPFRVQGELIAPVAGLSMPTGSDVGEQDVSVATDAVQLFVARATERRPDFALTPASTRNVVELCRMLDGLPLAIELAAAHISSLSVRDLVNRVSAGLGVLATGTRGGDARQASMRAAIAWSYDLLECSEQQLFARLSVFRGGCTFDAVETVCSGAGVSDTDVADLLDRLVDRSLVVFAEDVSGEGRYDLLETIRAFATERLAESDADSVRYRHAAYFSGLSSYKASGDQNSAVLDRLDMEHANLSAAIDYLARAGSAEDHGWLVANLAPYWDLRGRWSESRVELERYLGRTDRPSSLDVHCVPSLGRVCMVLGDVASARQHFDHGRRLAHDVGDRGAESGCLGHLGHLARGVGDYASAATYYQQACALANVAGDPLAGFWLIGLANACQELGRYADAEHRLLEALRMSANLGNRRLEAGCLLFLGLLEVHQGHYPAARPRLRQAIELARAVGDAMWRAQAVAGMAVLDLHLGDAAKAHEGLSLAVDAAREVSNRRAEALYLLDLGAAAMVLGRMDETAAHLDQSLRIHLANGFRDTLLLERCGAALAAAGLCDRSATLLGAADSLAEQVGRVRSAWDAKRFAATLTTCGQALGDVVLDETLKGAREYDWLTATELAATALREVLAKNTVGRVGLEPTAKGL